MITKIRINGEDRLAVVLPVELEKLTRVKVRQLDVYKEKEILGKKMQSVESFVLDYNFRNVDYKGNLLLGKVVDDGVEYLAMIVPASAGEQVLSVNLMGAKASKKTVFMGETLESEVFYSERYMKEEIDDAEMANVQYLQVMLGGMRCNEGGVR